MSEGFKKRGSATTDATEPPVFPGRDRTVRSPVRWLPAGQPAGCPRRYHLSGMYSNIPLDHLLPLTESHPLPNGQPVPICSRASCPVTLRQCGTCGTSSGFSPHPQAQSETISDIPPEPPDSFGYTRPKLHSNSICHAILPVSTRRTRHSLLGDHSLDRRTRHHLVVAPPPHTSQPTGQRPCSRTGSWPRQPDRCLRRSPSRRRRTRSLTPGFTACAGSSARHRPARTASRPRHCRPLRRRPATRRDQPTDQPTAGSPSLRRTLGPPLA